MNLNRADHNIYGLTADLRSATSLALNPHLAASQAGYALVALLAVMTVMALFALAVAPSVRQQVQREREKEAIFRGEQVADAIRDYYVYRRSATGAAGDAALPNSMDQLLEGIPMQGGSKKRQILRASAAHDPLTASGEWGLVRPRSQMLISFERSVMIYAGNVLPAPRSPQIAELQGLMVPALTNVLALDSADSATSDADKSANSDGPFVGVFSRSPADAVVYYYGIGRHDEWIFTPLFR